MKMNFCLLRNNVTSTSVNMDLVKLDVMKRWIVSNIRNSGADTNRYHFMAFGTLSDISATDVLEEITGTVTGSVYDIINKREITGSHLEFDLEKRCHLV